MGIPTRGRGSIGFDRGAKKRAFKLLAQIEDKGPTKSKVKTKKKKTKLKQLLKKIKALQKLWNEATFEEDLAPTKKKAARFKKQAKKLSKRITALDKKIDKIKG